MTGNDNPIIRQRISFYGRVQGVGFRWRARMAAEDLGLTGFVRNEYDGSVTMECQGRRDQIDRMIEALCDDRYIRIDDMDRRTIEVKPGDTDFHVHHI